ncbi:MAG: hypothetical protein ACREDR_00485 [Blastocatellia bacterium]
MLLAVPFRHQHMAYIIVLLLMYPAQLASNPERVCSCGPSPSIQNKLQNAESASSAVDSSAVVPDYDRKLAPFLALRKEYPDDLFVHERYQDAVARNGIEGHLKALAAEYQVLEINHQGDEMYHYLFLRSLVGRSTEMAIQGLTDMITANPNFGPAHQTLAEMYGSAAFRNLEKQKAETTKFLALCPGSQFTAQPGSLPEPSPLVNQAEQLLSQKGDPNRIVAMTVEGLRKDEWRNQRVRSVDWYSMEFKRKALLDLRVEYWRAWSIQVRCYQRAGQTLQAAALLDSMEEKAGALGRRSPPGYWEALLTLAQLYIGSGQMDRASRTIAGMEQYLTKNPDTKNAAVLASLRRVMSATAARP